jgi:predicted nucleic acid-binding protein
MPKRMILIGLTESTIFLTIAEAEFVITGDRHLLSLKT